MIRIATLVIHALAEVCTVLLLLIVDFVVQLVVQQIHN